MSEKKIRVRIANGSDRALVDSLLERNTSNRSVKLRHVQYLKDEILSGNWCLTNQGVGVSASGVLTDGQHRLLAIQAAGYPPVEFVLVEGLDENASRFVDIGAKRTASDLLKLVFDLSLASRYASAITVWLKVKNERWFGKFSPSALLEGYEEIGAALKFVYSTEGATRLAAPVACAFAEIYRETGDVRVRDFVSQVLRGEMLKSGDPAYALRNFLASAMGVKSGGDLQKIRYLKTMNATRAFLEGRELFRLYATEN